jgi:hypothetical protein
MSTAQSCAKYSRRRYGRFPAILGATSSGWRLNAASSKACALRGAVPQDWIVNRRINVLVRFSPKRPPDMAANVPHVVDLAKTQEQRDLLLVLNGPSEVGRPLIVAKGVPRERVATLRAALEKMLEDRSFLGEAQKQNLPLDPVTGAEAEQIIRSIYATPPELARKVKAVLE